MAGALVSAPARVTAIFAQSRLHFEVARDTPVEELCALLHDLGRGHGRPLTVEITLPLDGRPPPLR